MRAWVGRDLAGDGIEDMKSKDGRSASRNQVQQHALTISQSHSFISINFPVSRPLSVPTIQARREIRYTIMPLLIDRNLKAIARLFEKEKSKHAHCFDMSLHLCPALYTIVERKRGKMDTNVLDP